MAERLALLPERPGEPPDLPPFDYHQPLVTDTTRIRRRLGYADVIDERPAMMQLAALATSSPKNGRA